MDKYMSEKQFEDILIENEGLNNLITQNKINTLTKLPNKESFDNDFINWLSPKFYKSFTTIYDEQINAKNKSGLVRIMRSEWLCNDETEKSIYDFLKPHINKTVQLSEKLKTSFKNTKDTEELVKLTNEIDENIFNYVNKALFTKKNESITAFKETLTDDCLEICRILRDKRMSKDVKNILIASITESFNNITLAKTQSESINMHKSKANSSMTVSIVIGALLALFAVIRLIMKLS